MGLMLTCQKVECEEEILQRILSTMILPEIDCKIAYTEFLKCIDKEKNLNYFKFQNFIKVIIGNNIYKLAQKEFFDNLFRNGDKSIRVIGSIIIFLAKGTKTSKIELLKIHFTNYYQGINDNSIKEFVQDIIDANTDNCIVSFKNNLSIDLVRNMCDIYQKKRKRKLENFILNNYDGIKTKYYNHKNNNEIILEEEGYDEDNLLNNTLADLEENKKNLKHGKVITIEKEEDIFKSEEETMKNEKVLKEFFELTFSQLSGEFIRNWLYDEYLKDKPYDNTCF